MSQAVFLGAADAIKTDLDIDSIAYKKLPLRTRLEQLDAFSFNSLRELLGCPDLAEHVTDVIGMNRSLFDDYGFQDTIRRAGRLGLSGGHCHTVDNGGASVTSGLLAARRLIAEDDRRVILLIGSDIPRTGMRGQADYALRNKDIMEPETEYDAGSGLIPLYALLGQALYKEGVSEEDYRAITRFYRDQAQRDERASTCGRELTDRILDRYLATPYSSAMVALADDHGFCALVTSKKRAPEFSNRPGLEILGGSVKSYGKYFIRRNGFSSPAAPAAREAFDRCGLSPGDVDYAWIYDCFTGMLVQQAADYFGINPGEAARSLHNGRLRIADGKEIEINAHANLLNYQAAINISGGTGLIDIGRRYGLAPTIEADRPGEGDPDRPNENIILLGGNGGIDTSNGVVLFARDSSTVQSKVRDFPVFEKVPPANNPEFESGTTGQIEVMTTVRFNPDPAFRPPYILCLIRRADGQASLARLATAGGELFRPEANDNSAPCEVGQSVTLVRHDELGVLARPD